MADLAQKTQETYGCFFIIPLKFDPKTFNRAQLERIGTLVPVRTMDLNENIKAMLTPSSGAAVGAGYVIRTADLAAPLGPGAGVEGWLSLQVTGGEETFPLTLWDSWIYVFHTRVAFLCLNLSFRQMDALRTMCNPGWAHNDAAFAWLDGSGEQHPFSIEQWLSSLLAPLDLRKFFDGDSSYLLDAYTYVFAVVPEWFENLEQMRRLTFNLHKMVSLDTLIEDLAEEDVRYTYAAKNESVNAYRWGCCVTSQTISYVAANEEMDFHAERDAQAEDGLPVVLLSLYEKYTCLRFTELIAQRKKEQVRELKDLMLNFQAFGTVTPANLSRWHNVKQTYANLLAVNDIAAAVQDISAKVSILTAHQEAIEQERRDTVINLITLFGIVSILASVLSIVQILSDGGTLLWISTILTAIMLVLVTLLAVLRR